jgi:hypothetical protein
MMLLKSCPDACRDLLPQAVPSVGFDEVQDRDQQRSQPDEDELQHLVEKR